MAGQSLKDKTVKGTFWSAADAFSGHGVLLLVGIVLARLLTPEDYGLIGIITIFTTVMMGIMDSGFSSALIRKKDVTDEDYNTLFIFNLTISVTLFALLYAVAPWIAHFFERPQLMQLVRVMGLILILQSLCIVQETMLKIRIDFKTKTKASFISAVSSGAIGIGMALAGFGVWSLVGQQLSRQLIYSLCLWILNHWWPKLKLSFEGKGHTAGLHSNSQANIIKAGSELSVSRLIVNAICATTAGGSIQNGLPVTNTLGCGSWGGNSISENFTFKHLLNITRIAPLSVRLRVPTDDEIWMEC